MLYWYEQNKKLEDLVVVQKGEIDELKKEVSSLQEQIQSQIAIKQPQAEDIREIAKVSQCVQGN